MGHRAELRKIAQRHLVLFFADLEDVVHRYGYLRTIATIVPATAGLASLSPIVGVIWLRVTFITIAAATLLTLFGVAFSGVEKLRARVRIGEDLAHQYAHALRNFMTPVALKNWREEVTVDANGDIYCVREITLRDNTGDIPQYLKAGLSRSGSSEMSARERRLVQCETFHADGADTDRGVRANSTSIWTSDSDGHDRLEVFVHLGTRVKAGDRVTITWRWPRYSAPLIKGDEPEEFFVIFNQPVENFTYRVIFRNATAGPRRLQVRNLNAPNFACERTGPDMHITCHGECPELSARLGFKTDFTPRNSW